MNYTSRCKRCGASLVARGKKNSTILLLMHLRSNHLEWYHQLILLDARITTLKGNIDKIINDTFDKSFDMEKYII